MDQGAERRARLFQRSRKYSARQRHRTPIGRPSMIAAATAHVDERVLAHARKDLPLLQAQMTVGEALETIRREALGERIIYFYAVDENGALAGVLPTRRLLT